MQIEKKTSLTVLEVGMYRTQTARVRYMPSDIYPRMSGTSSGCLTLLEFGFGACLIRNGLGLKPSLKISEAIPSNNIS